MLALTLTGAYSAHAESDSLKVAIIKDATASKSIMTGDLDTSIEKLSKKSELESDFNTSMNLCVAYLKSENFEQSEVACTAAIDAIEAKVSRGRKMKLLHSLSYNNRAVARYLGSDFEGAIQDLTLASSIHPAALTEDNLKTLKSKISQAEETTLSMMSE